MHEEPPESRQVLQMRKPCIADAGTAQGETFSLGNSPTTASPASVISLPVQPKVV